MVVINQRKNLNFGDNNPAEISLNSNLKRWFSRNIGLWKSNRTYFIDEVQKTERYFPSYSVFYKHILWRYESRKQILLALDRETERLS